MRTSPRWQRLRDLILSTQPRRRTVVSMALLALLLMAGSAGVMLLVAHSSDALNRQAIEWWAAFSVGGLAAMTVYIRCGYTMQLRDPSITVPQMVWTITSGAVAYVLAGDARGLVPSVLAMILFFGTFALNTAQVIAMGTYALLAFLGAIATATRFSDHPFRYLDAAYALMVLIVLTGCLVLSLRIQRIRQRLREQREALAQALEVNRALATRDDLTGLYNRRAMLELMELEHRRSLRNGRPLMLAQLDIDHFKPINDTYGHATGDRALQAFAGTVNACVRDTDVLARWGGEEFVLMFSDLPPADAKDTLERIRGAVGALEIPHADGVVRMTVSAGLAQHLPGDALEHTLERADQALYTAKALGRDRVAVAPPLGRPARAGADGDGASGVSARV